ncbi:hypothetical protein [Peribacillus sp. NPDC097077]|uniref:hypothetical protein n=1 Tax=Peribacillus sp. NPDC097077 TaxID=3390613 RepID=UPI003D00E59D
MKGIANVLLAGRHWLCLRMSLSIKNDSGHLMGKGGKKKRGEASRGKEMCALIGTFHGFQSLAFTRNFSAFAFDMLA